LILLSPSFVSISLYLAVLSFVEPSSIRFIQARTKRSYALDATIFKLDNVSASSIIAEAQKKRESKG
jgi:hypothetical protein